MDAVHILLKQIFDQFIQGGKRYGADMKFQGSIPGPSTVTLTRIMDSAHHMS